MSTLIKWSISEGELAQQLDWPEAQVRLLLDGMLPQERLPDDLRRRIGERLQCDVALMEIILDRPAPAVPYDTGESDRYCGDFSTHADAQAFLWRRVVQHRTRTI
jgi:hypothetical protein